MYVNSTLKRLFSLHNYFLSRLVLNIEEEEDEEEEKKKTK